MRRDETSFVDADVPGLNDFCGTDTGFCGRPKTQSKDLVLGVW